MITTILVGPNEEKFSIHKALLCERTEYFPVAYNGTMKEAQEDLFKFEDVDDTTFRTLCMWLYTSQIILDPASVSLPATDCEQAVQGGEVSKATSSDDSSFEMSSSDGGDSRESTSQDEVSLAAMSDGVEDSSGGVDTDDDDNDNAASEEIALTSDQLERDSLTEEQCVIRWHCDFPGHPSDFDVYQLETLLAMTKEDFTARRFRSGWQQILEKKRRDSDQNMSVTTFRNDTQAFTKFIDLYVLADRLGIHELQIQAINLLQHERDQALETQDRACLPTFDDVSRAFDNLPPTSPLRTWLMHVFAYDWNPSADDVEQSAAIERLPKNFALGTMVLNTNRINGNGSMDVAPFDLDLCYYHQHNYWENVVACRRKRGKNPEQGMISYEDFGVDDV